VKEAADETVWESVLHGLKASGRRETGGEYERGAKPAPLFCYLWAPRLDAGTDRAARPGLENFP